MTKAAKKKQDEYHRLRSEKDIRERAIEKLQKQIDLLKEEAGQIQSDIFYLIRKPDEYFRFRELDKRHKEEMERMSK